MYEHILLPTDGSVEMAKAVEQSFHQATQNNSIIHVVYVVDVRAYVMLPEETQKRVRELLMEEGENAVQFVKQQAEQRDIPIETVILEGIPHEEIIAYSDDEEMDLIVMGTHGQSGDQKRVLGSVAEEVVRRAEIPVLTVRMTKAEMKEVEVDIPEEQQRYIA
jgi:nucleotide-binding universal stress UspA family protein